MNRTAIEVVAHWAEAESWVVPPVVLGGDLLCPGSWFELLVGYTRLGNWCPEPNASPFEVGGEF
jgi:hypothetical protein